LQDRKVTVSGLVGTPDGERIVRSQVSGAREEAPDVARQVAQRLLDQGAAEIIEGLRET
jgi:hydroxymethylbilane synthase